MTHNSRRKGAALTAVVAGSMAAPALLAPTAAPAASPAATCPANTLCEWKNNGFNLPVKWWPAGHDAWNYSLDRYDSDTSQGLNDSISSVWNNTNRWVGLFQGANSQNAALCLTPGAGAFDLEKVKYGGTFGIIGEHDFGDKLSSHEFFPGDPHVCDKTVSDQACSL
jgi:Peptidase inhibitor family I36